MKNAAGKTASVRPSAPAKEENARDALRSAQLKQLQEEKKL